MLVLNQLYLLVCILLCLKSTQSFIQPRAFSKQLQPTLKMNLPTGIPPAPSDAKSRINIKISGATVTNALFRAELKKELTFFRGCSGIFTEKGKDQAEIVAEGKTTQLVRFVDWLKSLSLDISKRKPNFQGPNIIVQIVGAQWSEFKDELKGFQANKEAPTIAGTVVEGMMEAGNMAGTDESV